MNFKFLIPLRIEKKAIRQAASSRSYMPVENPVNTVTKYYLFGILVCLSTELHDLKNYALASMPEFHKTGS